MIGKKVYFYHEVADFFILWEACHDLATEIKNSF